MCGFKFYFPQLLAGQVTLSLSSYLLEMTFSFLNDF